MTNSFYPNRLREGRGSQTLKLPTDILLHKSGCYKMKLHAQLQRYSLQAKSPKDKVEKDNKINSNYKLPRCFDIS